MGISTVLGQAVVVPPDGTESPTPDVDDFLFDTEGLDDEDADLGGYNPGVMVSSEDVFSNHAAVSFNIAYFKNRGIESRYQTVAINGLEMENLVLGRASNTQWGGLTRIFNGAECKLNLSASPFAFGDIGGSSNYNIRASFAGELLPTGRCNLKGILVNSSSGPLLYLRSLEDVEVR